MGVGGELHAPAALYPGKRPISNCIGGWVGPKPLSSRIFQRLQFLLKLVALPQASRVSVITKGPPYAENTGMGTVIFRVRVVLMMWRVTQSAFSSGLNLHVSYWARICIHATKLYIGVLSR